MCRELFKQVVLTYRFNVTCVFRFSFITLWKYTWKQYIYQVIKNYIKEINIPLQKFVSMITDGAPATNGSDVGFITLCKNDTKFLNFFHYNCIIHQQAFCTKVLHYEHVMKVVLKIENSIRTIQTTSEQICRLVNSSNKRSSGIIMFSLTYIVADF